jgi:hypothetical protein
MKKLFLVPALILCATVGVVSAQQPARVVHVFVALADNDNQGIVPVPARLGNGEDAERNLYWGAAGGVKTYFRRSAEWSLLKSVSKPKYEVIERCIFKHKTKDVYLVADAYRGREIRQAILDFLVAAAGDGAETITIASAAGTVSINARGGANLVVYVGHDGLMDFHLPLLPHQKNSDRREAIILACASKSYFSEPLRVSGAYPLLWTTNLMAPEAYTLKSALDGWVVGESNEQIRNRAAAAYDRYQKCGIRAAQRLLVTGW